MAERALHGHCVQAGWVDHDLLRHVGADLTNCPGRCCRRRNPQPVNPMCCGVTHEQAITDALNSEDPNARAMAQAFLDHHRKAQTT